MTMRRHWRLFRGAMSSVMDSVCWTACRVSCVIWEKIKGQLDMGGYDDIMYGYYVYGAYSMNMTTDYLYLTSKTKPGYDMNTLGKKPGLKLAYRKDKQVLVDEVEAEVEVIKVDGSTVWMTFYVQTDILYSGCLVVGLTD